MGDKMIAIIDYGAGNLRSVQKAFEYIGADACITSNKSDILSAEKVVLPGVGAFGDCVSALRRDSLDECIYRVCEDGKPFLGICLGLQMLFEESEESPGVSGLGIFKGKNVQIPKKTNLKIPHMGWNSITFPKVSPLFDGINENSFVYFVHSYYMNPDDTSIISAVCDYSESLPVALSFNNIHATQFHPEKSGQTGLKILENFTKLGGDL